MMNSQEIQNKISILEARHEMFESEIIRVESDSNYAHIFLANQKKITLSKTLKEVEENIKGEPFFRVHQSHLINTNQIVKAVKGK